MFSHILIKIYQISKITPKIVENILKYLKNENIFKYLRIIDIEMIGINIKYL